MPALFIGHGSPMNTIEDNRFTRAWRDLGASLPRPRAVLCISAHWYVGETAVTAMPNPRTIHDFRGFPPELSTFRYPAPGLPALVEEVADLVQPVGVRADLASWGIDHGAWSVLAHLFPKADVPVVQLAIDANQPLQFHLELGARLAPLRHSGVLVLASGNVVHNLGWVQWNAPDAAEPWAESFDDAVADLMEHAPADILRAVEHPAYALAVPTPDHFIPLLHIAGIAAAESRTAKAMMRSYAMGSLSMTGYTVAPG